MEIIDHNELQKMMEDVEDVTVINVLSNKQFRGGHIPNSINVPFDSPRFIKIVEERAPDKDDKVVVHCSSEACDTSRKAAELLERYGYTDVYHFSGGIKEWHKYDHPLRILDEDENKLTAGDLMSTDIVYATEDMNVEEVSLMMKEREIGIFPIVKDNVPIGVVTDRDIIVRCLAEKREPVKCKLDDIMSRSIIICYEDDTLEEVIDKMGKNKVRRLPVVNERHHLVGMISIEDLAMAKQMREKTSSTLSRIGLAMRSH